jgi:4'-phosphopantetheinyl transferase
MKHLPVIWLLETDAAGGGKLPPAVDHSGMDLLPLASGEGWGEGSFLSENERRTLAGMRFEKRRREWLLGRRVAKRLLTSHFGCASTELSIEAEEGGAPVVWRNGQRVPGCLTISHRGEWGLSAWTDEPNLQIGADLEQVGPPDPEWLRDYLTEAEWDARIEQGAHWPYLAWSAKEAVLKALRIGLRVDTRSIEILLAERVEEIEGWKTLRVRSEMVKVECWAGWRQKHEMVMTLVVLRV